MKLPIRLLILFAILCFVYCWKSSQIIIAPRRFVFPYTPADFGLNYIHLKLLTRDKIELDAWFIPAGSDKELITQTPTIILCHGFGVDKGDCIRVAKFLHIAKYNVLMFDFRAHGQSGGKYCSLGYYECEDINAAINWLSGIGVKDIGAIGFSMGGTALLLAATKNPNLKAVVTDGAYTSFWGAVTSFAQFHFKAPKYPFIPPAVLTAGMRLGFNPSKLNLANFIPYNPPSHALIIHGSKDCEIPPSNAYQIYSLLTSHSPKSHTSLWIVEGAGHLGSYYIAQEEYEHRIIEFFSSAFNKEFSDNDAGFGG